MGSVIVAVDEVSGILCRFFHAGCNATSGPHIHESSGPNFEVHTREYILASAREI
jgi:hypothetical protein